MTSPFRVRRAVRIVDALRVARCRRAPEFGPRMVFLTGGSALRAFSRALKHLTHNSVHVVTTFDSGGSSATLRDAFAMPSIGDLRNRLLALADETVRGNPEMYRLFSFRLPADASARDLRDEFDRLVAGRHELMRALPEALREIVRTHLRDVSERLPDEFPLGGASLGNLVLAGGYLANERHLDAVLYLFSKLVEARGRVVPVTADDLDLASVLEDGTTLPRQHHLTGKVEPPIRSPVREVHLTTRDEPRAPASGTLHRHIPGLMAEADLICYPMGSFYSSVIANLLPAGAGAAIAASDVPKVFVPNTGVDPEQFGQNLDDLVQRLVEYVRRDAGPDTPIDHIVNAVLLDERDDPYRMDLPLGAVRDRGVAVVRHDLVAADGRIDGPRLAEALISIT